MADLMPNIFGATPPPKVYFQVLIEFNPEHPVIAERMNPDETLHESIPFDTFPAAMIAAEEAAKELRTKYSDCNVVQLDPEDVEDEFHFYLVDGDEDEIARVGVSVEDYRGERIH